MLNKPVICTIHYEVVYKQFMIQQADITNQLTDCPIYIYFKINHFNSMVDKNEISTIDL